MRPNARGITLLGLTIATLFTPDTLILAQRLPPEQQPAIGVVSSIITPLLLTPDSALEITSVSPFDDATNVELGDIFSATFSKPVANASVSTTTFKISQGADEVAATVILDAVNNQAKLVTNQTLALLTQYTVTLDGVTDLSGKALSATSWTFTSRDGTWMPAEAAVSKLTSASTRQSRIAVNSSGYAIAVWRQQNGSRFDIWANRYEPDRGWGLPELVETDDAYSASHPHVAIDHDGNATVVWERADGFFAASIWANRYEGGIGWGTPEPLETLSGAASSEQVAVDGAGNAIAVWSQDADSGITSIWANRLIPGLGWGGPVLLDTDVDNNAYNPHIAVNNNGISFAVWEQEDAAADYITRIRTNRYAPGSGWGIAQLVETNSSDYAYIPQIGVDAAGNAIAVWVQEDSTPPDYITYIWTNRYTAGGGWGSAALLETDDFNYADTPQIAVDASGSAIAIWQQEDYDVISQNTGLPISNLWTNRYVPGSGWSGPELIEADSDSDAFNPGIVMDDAGNAMAVWESQLIVSKSIRANRYVHGGGWADPVSVGEISAFGPHIASDSFGNMLVVWDKSDAAGQEGIFFNRFGGGGEPNGKLISETVFSDSLLGDCVSAAAAANSWHFVQEITALSCPNLGIRSLGGLQTFVNLETLDISGNPIDGLSVIERFPALRELNVSNIPGLSGIDTLLSRDQLQQVDMSGSGSGTLDCHVLDTLGNIGVSVIPPGSCRQRIADVAFDDAELQTCVSAAAARERATFVDELKFLDCDRGSGIGIIQELNGVEVFNNLEAVNIDRSQVADLTPLVGLTRLKRLDASSTYVSTLAPIASAPALEVLILKSIPSLYGTDPTGISILSDMPSLREAYLDQKDYCPGQPQCVTGGGRLDCETLDSLESTLDIFVRPQSCNMPIAHVNFTDSNLQACVEAKVAGSVDPHTNDVLTLDCHDKGITQLVGLERFGKLEKLYLESNPIQDLTPLNSIFALKELNVSSTGIVDFYALSDLILLQNLYAQNITGLVDIRELTTMPRLTRVYLGGSGNGTITCEEVSLLQAIVTTPPDYVFPGDIIYHIFEAPPCDGAGVITRDVRTTDVNADGADDLVLEFDATDETLYTSSWTPAMSLGGSFGQGGVLAGFSKASYSRARAVGLADANGDGRDDLLLQLDSATDDTVYWYVRLSNGIGGWGATIGPVSMADGKINNGRAIAFKDINDDGYADILIENQVTVDVPILGDRSIDNYYLSMGNGSGYSSLNPSVPLYSFDLESQGRPRIAALEDINQDGKADLVYDLQRIVDLQLEHCLVVRTYQEGSGFSPDPGSSSCYKLTLDERVKLDASVADIDGNGRQELVISYRNTGSPEFGDWTLGYAALYLYESPTDSIWGGFTELGGEATDFSSGIKQEYRSVAVADLNSDLRADMLIEVTKEDGSKSWLAYVAVVDAATGYLVYQRQANWMPALSENSEYRALGVRDYNNDSGNLPDLLFARTNTGSGTTGLYVAVNNGSNFSSPVLWYQNTVSSRVIGLEEDGLTNLANDTSELIAWAGDTTLRTFQEFSLKLELEKGWKIVRGPELDPSIPVKENDCVFNYASADAGVTSNDELGMAEVKAEAKFGLLVCNVKALDGRIELKTQVVYGGCSAAATSTGGGGARCEVGLISGEMKFDMTPPPPLDQIPVEVDVMAKGPNAGACGAISLTNLCLNAEANLVDASYKTEVAGIGAGGSVGVGIGGGADFGIENGVISGTIKGKLGIGGEIDVSIDVNKTAKTFVRVGEDSYTYGQEAGKFVVYTAGPAVYKAANKVGGATLDGAGKVGNVVKTGAGDAVYFVAGESAKQRFIIFTNTLEKGINEILSDLEDASANAAVATYGFLFDAGNTIAGGAEAIWDAII